MVVWLLSRLLYSVILETMDHHFEKVGDMRLLIKTTIIISLLVSLPVTAIADSPGFMDPQIAMIKGQVVVDEGPISTNAIVAFFLESKGLPPISENMSRVPEFLGGTDPQGNFAVQLMAGDYYMGMLLREAGAEPGPPRKGEKFYLANDGQGKLRLFAIAPLQETDFGKINFSEPGVFKEIEEFFSVEGLLINGKTKEPYPGAVVMAKSDLNQPRPDYISKRTSSDGRFRLQVAAGESYYLIARETIAGPRPRPGEYLGTYGVKSAGGVNAGAIFGGGSPPPGVLDVEGQESGSPLLVHGGKGEVVSGLEILMFEMPDPEAIRGELQGTASSPKFETGAQLNNIFFAHNSYEIEDISIKELNNWVEFLKGRTDVAIELSGHTDSEGDDEFNR
jgi:hypothetical protein